MKFNIFAISACTSKYHCEWKWIRRRRREKKNKNAWPRSQFYCNGFWCKKIKFVSRLASPARKFICLRISFDSDGIAYQRSAHSHCAALIFYDLCACTYTKCTQMDGWIRRGGMKKTKNKNQGREQSMHKTRIALSRLLILNCYIPVSIKKFN